MRRSLSGLHRRIRMLSAHEQQVAVCDEDLLAILDEGSARRARNGESSGLIRAARTLWKRQRKVGLLPDRL